MKNYTITTLLITSIIFFCRTEVQAQKKEFNYDNPELQMDNLEFADDWYSLDISKDYYKIDISKLSYKKEAEYNNYRSLIQFTLKTKISEDNDFIVIMLQGRQWGILNRDKKFIAKNWEKVYREDNVLIGIRQNNKNLTEPISEPGTYYFQVIADEIPKTEQIIYLYVAKIEHKINREEYEAIEAGNRLAPSFIPVKPELVLVQGGTFTMGNNDADANSAEKPAHSVTLNTFSIGKYEITWGQYKAFCDAPGHPLPKIPRWGIYDNHPVTSVSYYDCLAYCNWLSVIYGGYWRLPTEAEWEYAARGGNKSRGYKYSGSNIPDEVGWFSENTSLHSMAVGIKKPNELGIYDMTGNEWEWCMDFYDDEYYSSS